MNTVLLVLLAISAYLALGHMMFHLFGITSWFSDLTYPDEPGLYKEDYVFVFIVLCYLFWPIVVLVDSVSERSRR